MLTQEVVDETVSRLALMPFFPSSDPGARGVLTKEIINMASNNGQVVWLGYRMIQLYPKQWPGIAELRAVFCKRFKPADGVQVNSAVYDEFPTEAQLGPVPGFSNCGYALSPTERDVIEAASIPATRQLEAGEVSVDPDLEKTIHELAEAARMPSGPIEHRTKEEIEYDLYHRPRITQADVDRELAARGK